MKIQTEKLTGVTLDWAVAKCEGNLITFGRYGPSGQWEMYSTDWSLAGPIIEREKIKLFSDFGGWAAASRDTPEWDRNPDIWGAHTPLIAAMRCYVASKLGDEIETPEGLL